MQLQPTHYVGPEEDPSLSSSPAGQVRVLVVGDSGVGKTSLVHLITTGQPTRNPQRTVGCNVSVKYVDGDQRSAGVLHGAFPSSRTEGLHFRERPPAGDHRGRGRGYFVELWDVSGHEEYKSSRAIYYSQINGVIFVHDLSRRKSRVSALHWLAELAKHGTFSAPSQPRRPGMLPVPLLVVGNKGDIKEIDPLYKGAAKLWEAVQGSPGLRAARGWAERNRWLGMGFGSGSDLPDYIQNPHASGLVACARDGRLDMRAIIGFFADLIERRYFMEHMAPLPSPSKSWTNPYFNANSCAPSAATTPPSGLGSFYGTPAGPSPSYLSFDPLLSTVYGARSKLVRLQGGGGGGSSYEWASTPDQHSVRVDDCFSVQSDSLVTSEDGMGDMSDREGSQMTPTSKGRDCTPPRREPAGSACPNSFRAELDGEPVAWSREEALSVDSLGPSGSWSSLAQDGDFGKGAFTPSSSGLDADLSPVRIRRTEGSTDQAHSPLHDRAEAALTEGSAHGETHERQECEGRAQQGSHFGSFGGCNNSCELRDGGHVGEDRVTPASELLSVGPDKASALWQGTRCPPAFRHDKVVHVRMSPRRLGMGSSPPHGSSPAKGTRRTLGPRCSSNEPPSSRQSIDVHEEPPSLSTGHTW